MSEFRDVAASEGAPTQYGAETCRVERWPTESALLVFTVLAAVGMWGLICLTVIGPIYAVLLGVFFFLSHLSFVAYLRGSAVRLGPEQFPELHRRVEAMAARAGLKRMPEAYLMQAGGALNAFATKFLRADIMVLFTDLLEACGDDEAARDMVIGHELGHHRAGHLRWQWFLLPGMVVPFLGTALSRAREYTCDRYGAALCGERGGALRGLGILAAGGAHGRRINLEALARQREQLNTGWMTLGKWLGTHPQLSERLAALEPRLYAARSSSSAGAARALGIIALAFVLPMGVTGFAGAKLVSKFQEAMQSAARKSEGGPAPGWSSEAATNQVGDDFNLLATVAEEFEERTGSYPASEAALYNLWRVHRPGEPEPFDPFDGLRYSYRLEEGYFTLLSSGPDADSNTEDDLTMDSRARAPRRAQ